jgi:hypothetical protein
MEILITDVTEMGEGKCCVAGWDVVAKRMVRPLPNGDNWPAALIAQHGIVPGKLVRAQPRGASNGTFPHKTEDTPVDPASISASEDVFTDWLAASAPEVAADLDTGFDGHLQWNKVWNGVKQGVHTEPKVRCKSLVAVRVPTENLSFDVVFNSLKATLYDESDMYQLTVSSKVLKVAWRAGGLPAVYNALPARDEFHVRVGLARPYDTPPPCYAMLNGVL